MLCKAPFLGITIDPAGWIRLCCATNDKEYFGKKITDIDDLNDFFLSNSYDKIRSDMKSKGLESIDQCQHCWGAINGEWTEVNNYNSKEYGEPLKIRYLEVTTSNVCNQTCVTCSSYFSTKWRKIEKYFERDPSPSFYLDDQSIDKILTVLPDLYYLQIKGGEPFADKNNLKILKELAKVNPNCKLIITSNFQNIPDEWYETLSLLKNIEAAASIDGTYQNYDWIRGGNFSETVNNMKKFYELTNSPLVINVCVSLYNIFILNDIKNYFKDEEYVSFMIFNNIVNWPEHLSIKLLERHDIIMALGVGIRDESFNNIRVIDNAFEINKKKIQKFFRHTESMNRIRGFNIFDIQPQLLNILNEKLS